MFHKTVFCTFLLIVSSFINAQDKTDSVKTDSVKVYKPAVLPAGYTQQLNVVYTSGAGWDKKLDLYIPSSNGKPTPVIINFHGGGWVSGVKESQSGGFRTYFQEGWAVANVEYRMTHEAKAPAAVEDARCALIYIINNAKALNIDVNKIVIVGGSAGGHLAMMAGLLGNDHRFDTNCPKVDKIKVAAIIDKWGINDVWAWAYCCKSHSAQNWLDTRKKDEAFAKSLSPINYVTKNSPPMFIVHGDADSTVPHEQSVILYNKLVELGVKSKFVTVPGGGHGKFTKEQTADVNKQIIEFIKNLETFK